MRNMLAIWREHRIDRVMREAWESGIVLAGLSAGAMCWFEGGVSMSGGTAEPVGGLGLLAGSLSVHRDSEPQRLPFYRQAIAHGDLPDGYALDDSVALLFVGRGLAQCVASSSRAGAVRITRGDGRTQASPLRVRVLPGAAGPLATVRHTRRPEPSEELALAELRLLRHGRGRWR